MMWVCRPGQHSKFYDSFVESKKIYLAWEGYKTNLSKMKERQEFRDLVIAEKNPGARTTISNWAGQLYSFSKEMSQGDYVLVPGKSSRTYSLAKIISDYKFCKTDAFAHSRDIEWIVMDAPREIFPQDIQYSLGAFRTLFKAKQEDYIRSAMEKWKKENANK